ncbi:uncharacterized protein LOC105842057 [Bombyx mori]|uniref:Uncharacterized protein n=1 Tax=Bombyx mori TaxID=7091 RepID=A0A8R2M7W4_BOMMO|nr:uncharacterized protein LOC105842057 [Bombyx mori]XP_037876215.1 uncharacterized protein LOC105842057 [Bombyx mori]XP_037876216.1 uncharacterized protein LOC105842057 [Bombyx mori]XP_037876217.1 uncharacterized protein LOC105842057 [Bombyx mori]
MKNQVVGKSREAKKLHDLYKYLVPKMSTHESSSQIIETTSKELMQYKDRSNLNEQNNDGSEDFTTMAALNELTTMPTDVELLLNEPELSTHEPQSKDTGTSKTNTMIDDYSGTSGHLKPLNVELQHQGVEELSLSSCINLTSTNDPIPEAVQMVEVISECEKENQTPIYVIPIPSTSRQSLELIGEKWVLVDDMPTEVPSKSPIKKQNIKDFLKLPKTPIKTQKAGIERRSFVLTSKDWEAVELEKQQKKMKEIQEKENKRIARLEKAKEKRLLKETKQAETINKKNKAKNLNLIKKSKPNSDSIKSKIVIQSNVLIKPANRISSDIKEKREYTKEIKKGPMNEVKPADITALKEIKNRPILDAVEAANERLFKESEQVQMVKKELKKGPILDELKPPKITFRDSRETGKDKKIKIKVNRLRPMTDEELLKMLEDD